MDFNIATCLLIVLACYIVGIIVKAVLKATSVDTQIISAILMIVGAILGAVIFAVDPTYLGVDSIFDAILCGIVSGFASTGANQLLKNFLPSGTVSTDTPTTPSSSDTEARG